MADKTAPTSTTVVTHRPPADIDPIIFNQHLVKARAAAKAQGDGNGGGIESAAYDITQALLGHAYSRIESRIGSAFDFLGYEPAFPQYQTLEEKKNIYKYSSYPTDRKSTDGSPLYPPHLMTIPDDQKVVQPGIFNFLGTLETGFLLQTLTPKTIEPTVIKEVQTPTGGSVLAKIDGGISDFTGFINRNVGKVSTSAENGLKDVENGVSSVTNVVENAGSAVENFFAGGLHLLSSTTKDTVNQIKGDVAQVIFHDVETIDGDNTKAADQGPTMKSYEDYNRYHHKDADKVVTEGRYANFGMLPDWYSDRRYAEQSFTGTNPTTITKIPQDLLDEFIQAAKDGNQSSWADHLSKADPSSLFVQDCRYFRKAAGVSDNVIMQHQEPNSVPNWSCAAVTLFELSAEGRLHPVAIVIDYKGTMANSVTIFNKRTSPTVEMDPSERTDWPWRYAKTCAQVSDWIRHEICVHLTYSHLIEESLIVATQRNIDMKHMVFRLLEPHWYKTLSLNASARAVLIPQVIKDLVGLNPDQLYAFIRYEYDNFDFTGGYIPNDLEKRGFPNTAEGLKDQKYKNYPYAKNMLSMWGATKTYVTSMLTAYYEAQPGSGSNDDKVSKDAQVAAWSAEIQKDGGIPSFPTIQTLNDLSDAVTMCIHIAATFHTAVNYLQNYYQAFIPAKPPTLCQPLPTSVEELEKVTETDLLSALPTHRQREWLLAAQLPWLLTFKTSPDQTLMGLLESQISYYAHSKDPIDLKAVAYSHDFLKTLRSLGDEFYANSDVMDEGRIDYTVMDPNNTATSILI